jgi:hypothetical protein
MAKPVRNSLGPFLLHHGCDRSLAELVLKGKTSPIPSENKYDWLGPGIYFWVDSPSRAMTWAKEKQQRKPEEMAEPSVLGAFAYPGHCLNLTDYGALDELRVAYEKVKLVVESEGGKLPSNGAMENGLEAYDSVYGIFVEGIDLFPGSGFKAKSHSQIAIRNPECMAGYFRVPDFT